MSDLVENHIVGFPTRRLISLTIAHRTFHQSSVMISFIGDDVLWVLNVSFCACSNE